MKEFKSYIFTGDKTTCTGCGACSKVCGKHALQMAPNEEGFLYPELDTDKCIKCGLCDLTCPVVNSNVANTADEQHCYIATTNHAEYYKESASIGVCTMLSDYAVKQNGLVFGCYLDESDWTAYHIGVEDLEGVRKIRNSKYLQSNLKDTFNQVKVALEQDRMVLYIGTPCQIAGLKAFLHKEYRTLYTVDLICHGTFSPKLMPQEVDYWEKLLGGKLYNFRFRSKRIFKYVNGGMVNFDIKLKAGKTRHVERHATASPTYLCYAYSADGQCYNLRLSCYNCPFRFEPRIADITVGDPWKVTCINNDKEFDGRNILRTIYSTNTLKGKSIMNNIDSILNSREFSRKELFCQDAVLPKPLSIPQRREELYNRIKTERYSNVVQDILSCDLLKAHNLFVKNYMQLTFKRNLYYLRQVFSPIYRYVRNLKEKH